MCLHNRQSHKGKHTVFLRNLAGSRRCQRWQVLGFARLRFPMGMGVFRANAIEPGCEGCTWLGLSILKGLWRCGALYGSLKYLRTANKHRSTSCGKHKGG